MLSFLLAAQAVMHAIIASEFNNLYDKRLTAVFIVVAVIDAMAAWVARNERV